MNKYRTDILEVSSISGKVLTNIIIHMTGDFETFLLVFPFNLHFYYIMGITTSYAYSYTVNQYTGNSNFLVRLSCNSE